ncbi:PaaI family thioesterase [Amycolatopsis sp. FDAARGOS 1241]|uniref:PaaI family thioesterase n=1 Tax=Amycolatopsis sp. FDAARGOS 1241 TaxID=2778070 RepID=UPI00194E9B02|nr:PaaI family thioesterase [Amycolatopsis sp. FDAARGOS 1241]QRP42934.1 PaaI family thioesterase [Amycolatopsis sp. FDAARGOS 1241]
MTVAEPLTGLDFLRAMVDGRSPQAAICRTLGFALVDATAEAAVFEGMAGEHLYNPMNTVNGGFLATLLDAATASAVIARLPAGVATTTAQLNVNFVRPVSARSGLLRATGTVVHIGRTMATAEGRVEGVDGKLYAHGTATCAVFPAAA